MRPVPSAPTELQEGLEPGVPWWALASAGATPLLLVGGWTLGAERQPAGFNSVRDTISALAAIGATDRWIMTTALAGLGACYAVTGFGLRPAGKVGRALLVGGGVGTLLVAAFPQPVSGNGVSHTIAATLAFTALAAWPVFAGTPAHSRALVDPPGFGRSHRGHVRAALVVRAGSRRFAPWPRRTQRGAVRGRVAPLGRRQCPTGRASYGPRCGAARGARGTCPYLRNP